MGVAENESAGFIWRETIQVGQVKTVCVCVCVSVFAMPISPAVCPVCRQSVRLGSRSCTRAQCPAYPVAQ